MSTNKAIDLLKAEAGRFSINLSEEQLNKLNSYLRSLETYNQKVNLVSDAEPVTVVKRHILDCLALIVPIQSVPAAMENNGEPLKLLDIGSGAGLPGLVLAIAFPNADVVLVDSVGKKTAFLKEIIEELSMSDRVEVITARAEELASTAHRASYDIVTSRAVGHLGMVTELAMPFLTINGRLFCQKTEGQAETEIAELEPSLKGLGAAVPEILIPEIQVAEKKHVIVSVEKINSTAKKFPRQWSEIIRQWK